MMKVRRMTVGTHWQEMDCIEHETESDDEFWRGPWLIQERKRHSDDARSN